MVKNKSTKRAIYLFTNQRRDSAQRVLNGEESDDHFQGVFRLHKYGVEADFIELENKFSPKIATFLRTHILSMHFVHVVLLPYMRKYDFVITATGIGTLLIKYLFHLPPKKWIMIDYNVSGLLSQNDTLKQKLFSWIMSKVDGFITLSKEEAEVLKGIYPDKANAILFLPFACDTEYFKVNKTVPEENFILSVGRDPGRDWNTFFLAVSGLNIPCKVTAKQSQIESIPVIPKEVARHEFSAEELLIEYSKAKLVVLPLNPIFPHDTMGCSTLVQAMAMGKAVIATDTVTVRNYITHNVNGILVPQRDPIALRNAIESLLVDDKKRHTLGVEARKFVKENCNPDVFSSNLAKFLLDFS